MNIPDAPPNEKAYTISVHVAAEQWRGEYRYQVYDAFDVLTPVAVGYAHTPTDALEAAREAARRHANYEPYEESYVPRPAGT